MTKRPAVWLSLSMMAITAGCTVETPGCPAVTGEFFAQYQYVPGYGTPAPGQAGCPIGPYILPVDGGKGVKTTVRRYAEKHVETAVVLKGCEIALDIHVTTPSGVRVAQLEGDVNVINNDHLGGTMQGWVFDATGNATHCSGLYNADLQRMVEGAPAATPAPQQPAAGSGAPATGQTTGI